MTARSARHFGVLMASWVAAVVVMCILAGALWMSWGPSYKGQSIAYYFPDLPVLSASESVGVTGFVPANSTATRPSAADCRAALAAIRAMGTNGLPFLISKLQGRPPPRLIKLIQRYAGDWPVIRTLVPVRNAGREQGQALAGLLVLCPLPPDAETKVRALALDFYGSSWFAAGYVLKANRDPRIAQQALKPYLE